MQQPSQQAPSGAVWYPWRYNGSARSARPAHRWPWQSAPGPSASDVEWRPTGRCPGSRASLKAHGRTSPSCGGPRRYRRDPSPQHSSLVFGVFFPAWRKMKHQKRFIVNSIHVSGLRWRPQNAQESGFYPSNRYLRHPPFLVEVRNACPHLGV